MLKPRRGAEPPINLLLLGVLLFTAEGVAGPFRTPDLTAAMVGVMVFLSATAYRHAVPIGTGGRLAYAMIRGCALWLILGAAIYMGLSEAPLEEEVRPLFLKVDEVLPERFWFPLGWAVLTVFSFLIGPKGHPFVRN
ncbi:MAG: hypothetical protein KDK26_12325 [Roseivivax sp.]|nr:hypothetical protein [Roseivivax sp.]